MVIVVSTQPHPSVLKETVCHNCGSTLQYVPVDIREKTVSDYLGDKDKVYYIECPVCGNDHAVKR